MKPYRYIGEELDGFALARNWKTYVRSVVGEFLGGDVLEVGAGIGGTTRVFCDGQQRSWTCLEPDRDLAAILRKRLAEAPLPITPEVIAGTIGDLPSTQKYDAIVYMDVLEHIEDDSAEVVRACQLLRPGGRIVVLSPAHQYLYTPFDAAIGHFRRYNRSMFMGLTPPAATLESVRYLDSVGMVLSAANRIFLRSSRPTQAQIQLWDRWFVVASRRVDRMLGWRVGKSILGIWRRRER
jgi:2-polyprenyl-3-methyl-5-hydroxy-6-metoxy-1,4-benzoquinol methylase